MTFRAFIIRSPIATAPTQDGRYEFRVWPERAPPAIPLLQVGWPLIHAETRADIYLLTRHSPQMLVKLRGGTHLEAKQRQADWNGLQHWTVPLDQKFPLSRSALNRLSVALGLARGLVPDASLSPAHLLAALSSDSPGALARTVRKSRLIFQRVSCRAEITHASWAGRSRLTVALEHPDAASLAHEINALGLQDLPNRSYGDVLTAGPIALAGPSSHLRSST